MFILPLNSILSIYWFQCLITVNTELSSGEEEEGGGIINHTKMVKGRQGERVRLYVRGSILGYKRSKSNQYPNTSLIQIEGVNTKEEVTWYNGKRMAYIYKAKVKKNGSHYRCIWGKVTRPHGNSGIVRAKFKSNLPPRSMGARVRVFMYPSNI
ncbi:hypothetical protein VNO77_30280 [Canavalia gladiata]|uniref:Ribosomal protein L35a n=1 Tax=Canavalia gladiata TaxID=3824 RepID=A0AAN9Q359_CANGL